MARESPEVERARELLSGTAQSLEKIAMRCGFFSRQQMARAFEKLLHTTPAAFRAQLQNL
ncbi:MAG: helix-turn-helix domain-containing protein [Burkholderiales bacterium]|nr:MAG: helix-turn-helix domain-containing protein [Burkholderiales bacterium]